MTEDDRLRVLRIMCNQGKMVATYESKLISRNAPFDRYVAGDESALDLGGDPARGAKAKRGLRLFITKAGCANCHTGPFFTDQKFYNIGVAQLGPNVPMTDEGRFKELKALNTTDVMKRPCGPTGPFSDDPSQPWDGDLTERDELKGAFRTGSLRNISQSAPYMHNGALASLRDVVEFYNRGGDETGFVGTKHPRMLPLGLSPAEIDEIVEFLLTLTGESIPEEYTSMPTLPYPPS
jgi:cytochrome c peroxidase